MLVHRSYGELFNLPFKMCREVQEGGKIANSSDEEGPGSSDIGVSVFV